MPTLCWTALASEYYIAAGDGIKLDVYYNCVWHAYEMCHEAWQDSWPALF